MQKDWKVSAGPSWFIASAVPPSAYCLAMTNPNVDIETRGDVRILWWRDEENRFNPSTLGSLHAALDELDSTEGPLALVLANEGKIFSNGLDLEWMMSASGTGSFFADLYRLFGRVLSFGGVTASAIAGHAFGAGAILSVCADSRVMRSDRGYWCMPEADMGVEVSDGLLAPLRAQLTTHTVQRVLVTADRLNADRAVQAGIAHAAVPEADVVNTAVSIVEPYVGKDRLVCAIHKSMIHKDTLGILGVEPTIR